MLSYTNKKIYGRAGVRNWVGFVFFTILFSFLIVCLIVIIRRFESSSLGFKIAVLFLMILIFPMLYYNILSIKRSWNMYIILGKSGIEYHDGIKVHTIYFPNIKYLKSELVIDFLRGGVLYSFIASQYQIHINDGKSDIYIKELNFDKYYLQYVFAWLAENSIDCDFGVQDNAKYLKTIKKSHLYIYKSTPEFQNPEIRFKEIKRETMFLSIFIVITIIIASFIGLAYNSGVVVRIKELSYPEFSASTTMDVTITLENQGDQKAKMNDIEVTIEGSNIIDINFTWHCDIEPQKTSTVTKQVDVGYNPVLTFYSLKATLYYKGEVVDREF